MKKTIVAVVVLAMLAIAAVTVSAQDDIGQIVWRLRCPAGASVTLFPLPGGAQVVTCIYIW